MTEKEAALGAVAAAVKFCAGIQDTMVNKTAVIKADRTPVTVADFGAQAIISGMLSRSMPDIGIISEERSIDLIEGGNPGLPLILKKGINELFDPEAEIVDICGWIDAGAGVKGSRQWVLDPVDGTKGFLRGGQYAIALALMVEGRIVSGFLGCPNLAYDAGREGCIFTAERGRGAWQIWTGDLSVKKAVHVSSEKEGHLMKFVESVEKEHADHGFHDKMCRTLGVEKSPERLDSQAKYGIVARGEASAYLRLPSPDHPDYRQKIWDHAAGFVVVEEAGGKVTDIYGRALDFTQGITLKNNNGIVATNGSCHELIIGTIRDIMKTGPAKITG